MPDQIPLHVHRDGPDDPLVVHVEHWPQSIRIDEGILGWEHRSGQSRVGECLKLTVDNGWAHYRFAGYTSVLLGPLAILESSRLDRSTL